MVKTTGKVTIKKYANRRLYDTESSSYITLDRLGAMIREGREFEVIDAKSGDDITHQVLTQIIVEEESRGDGATMLPVNFLRQLIGLYGGAMQPAVPQYLDAAMDMFSKNQAAMRDAMSGAAGGARGGAAAVCPYLASTATEWGGGWGMRGRRTASPESPPASSSGPASNFSATPATASTTSSAATMGSPSSSSPVTSFRQTPLI